MTLMAAACAPPASLRPLGGLPETRNMEVGGAFAGVSPRPYATESWHYVGQAWTTLRLTQALDVSAITAFDTSGFALGGAAQLAFFRSSHLRLGGEVELGWLWAALALPVSVRLFDELRIYTAPRLGNWGGYWAPGIPVGLSVPLYAGFVLRAEVQMSWADFAYYNRRVIGAGALVYQF
jgi:hypothetical protein